MESIYGLYSYYGVVNCNRWGVSKEEQLAAVKGVYDEQDVFVCLPTGYGKSLCYQTLPFQMEHKLGGNKGILVMSPLVALMEDQVYRLKKYGVRASILSSSTSVSLQLSALAETFFFALEALTTVKWRDAFEREGFFFTHSGYSCG